MPNPPKKTALVTGASRGIGKALAHEFASQGYDLVLVARTSNELSRIGQDCERLYGSKSLCLAEDLSIPGAVASLVRSLTEHAIVVDTLVNNAGFGIHGAFCQTPITRELELIQMQISVTVELTKALLPGMVERRRGEILNVASVYSFAAVPFQSVYSAGKSFLLSFSESLASEVKSFGIVVTVLCPGVTQTGFRNAAGMREKKPTAGMSAEAVARIGFRGLKKGKGVVVPGLVNRLFVGVVRHLSGATVTALMRIINKWRGVNPGH